MEETDDSRIRDGEACAPQTERTAPHSPPIMQRRSKSVRLLDNGCVNVVHAPWHSTRVLGVSEEGWTSGSFGRGATRRSVEIERRLSGEVDAAPLPNGPGTTNEPTIERRLSGDVHQIDAESDRDQRIAPLLRLTRPPRYNGGEPLSAAFGSLSFPQAGASTHSGSRTQKAKWAALAHTTRPSDVTALLTSTWALRWPHVVISVTGGAQALPELTPSARETFELGLLGAVRTTKAWVVTGGTDCGVMQCALLDAYSPH
jgi:hypothetical protein